MTERSHLHSHGPTQAQQPRNWTAAFTVGIVLNLGFVVVEGIYGLLANSMALIADAGLSW